MNVRSKCVPGTLLAAAALSMLGAPTSAAAQPVGDGPRLIPEPLGVTRITELEVVVTGLESDAGTVRIALFDDPARFTDDPVAAVVLEPSAGRATWRVAIPAGRYAVAAVHDRDADGTLDRRLLGMPSEPYGFSNEARGAFGPPSFEEASFDVEGPATRVEVVVR